MATLNTLKIMAQGQGRRAEEERGGAVVSAFCAVEYPEVVEVNDRLGAILRRSRARQVHHHGCPPDLSHGPRELGEVYDVVGAQEAESVVVFGALGLGEGLSLLTLGRWREGFFDIVQCFSRQGEAMAAEAELAVQDLIEGCGAALGVVASDLRALGAAMESMGMDEVAGELLSSPMLPVALNRDDLLAREGSVLGLVREDMLSARALEALGAGAASGADPKGLQRVLEAGRVDVITAMALFTERRALAFS